MAGSMHVSIRRPLPRSIRPAAIPLLAALALLGAGGESAAFLVTGTVRSQNGQGIAGVDIDAEDAETGEGIPLSGDGTDSSGFYDIFLPPGTYNIQLVPPAGSSFVAKEFEDVVVMDDVTLDATLPNGFFLFGTVRDPNLQPIAGIDVDVRDAATEVKLFTPGDNTNASGFYAIVVPDGTYKVLFRPDPSTSYPVRLFDNIVVSGQDRNLNANLQSGVRLFGTATDPSDDPLPGVELDVFDAVTGAKIWTFGSASDGSGFYEAALLAGNSYDLVYTGPSPWGYDEVIVDSLFISAPTQRDVQLRFPHTLRVRVRSAQNGNPVPSVRIDVISHAVGDEIPLDSNSTDVNGERDVKVPEGMVDVVLRSPEGNGLASRIHRDIQILDDAQLDSELPAGSALTGRVRGPNGQGVPSVDFDIVNAQTGLEMPVFDDDTDALGDYTLVLPAGSYDLEVFAGRGVRLVARLLTGVAVPQGGPFDIQLQAGVLLSGQVLDHVQNPWSAIDLDVRVAGTMNEIVTPGDDTDRNGDYLVTVPVGTYDLVFTPPPGVPVEEGVFEDVVVSGDLVYNAILSSTVIGVADEGTSGRVPGLTLEPNVPNPFNPSTRVGFVLDRPGPVTLRIFDVAGRGVRTLLAGAALPAGRHALAWDGLDDSGRPAVSGVYFLRLEAQGTGGIARKMVLAR